MLYALKKKVDPLASHEDLGILAAYREAKKQGAGKKKEGPPKKGWEKAKGGGQTLNGFNRKTGLRDG